MKSKKALMDWAELLDSLRVFPRSYLLLVTAWYIRVNGSIMGWYFDLPAGERTMIVNTFALGVLSASSVLLGYSFKIYSQGGRSWDGPPVADSTTINTTIAPK